MAILYALNEIRYQSNSLLFNGNFSIKSGFSANEGSIDDHARFFAIPVVVRLLNVILINSCTQTT